MSSNTISSRNTKINKSDAGHGTLRRDSLYEDTLRESYSIGHSDDSEEEISPQPHRQMGQQYHASLPNVQRRQSVKQRLKKVEAKVRISF